jgi:hypothetical protein
MAPSYLVSECSGFRASKRLLEVRGGKGVVNNADKAVLLATPALIAMSTMLSRGLVATQSTRRLLG